MALSKSTMVAGYGFEWKGRWGWWSRDGVLVLATCVGVFDVTLVHRNGVAQDDLLDSILQEVRQALQVELPSNAVLAAIHWCGAQEPSAEPRVLRVAIMCDPGVCDKLRVGWRRGRHVSGGAAVVHWSTYFDAASGEGQAQRTHDKFKGEIGNTTGVLLELPSRWFSSDVRHAQLVSLNPGAHWFEFAALFGDVVEAELHGARGTAAGFVSLLVRFATAEGAKHMYEALTDRYLYNQNNKQADDCWPAVCSLGELSDLRTKFRPRSHLPGLSNALTAPQVSLTCHAPAASTAIPGFGQASTASQAHFVLTRCGRGVAPVGAFGNPPNEVSLPIQRHTVGREGQATVIIPHPHVSKTHANLIVQESVGSGTQLILQDLSSNGTWVNGRKIEKGELLQVHVKDKISFLPPGSDLDQDPLTYEVKAGIALADVSEATKQLSTRSSRSRSPRRHLEYAKGVVESAMPFVDAPTLEAPTLEPPTAILEDPATLPMAEHAGEADDFEDAEEGDFHAILRERILGSTAADAVRNTALDTTAAKVELGPNSSATLLEGVGLLQANHETQDIGVWLRSIGLVIYEPSLASTYESVSQIVALYKNNMADFFEDNEVAEEEHRRAFVWAIQQRAHANDTPAGEITVL